MLTDRIKLDSPEKHESLDNKEKKLTDRIKLDSPEKYESLDNKEKKILQKVQADLYVASRQGETIASVEDQLDPPEISCCQCYVDAAIDCAECTARGAVVVVMILCLAFYFFFYLFYKLLGSLAACFYSHRQCCSNTGRTGHNPCGPCLGCLINAMFYVFFAFLGTFAYIFYIAHMGPLLVLALISETYKKEYGEKRFSLTLLLEEEETRPVASGRVADKDIGLAQTKSPNPKKVLQGWDEEAPRLHEEIMPAEAVVPLEAPKR